MAREAISHIGTLLSSSLDAPHTNRWRPSRSSKLLSVDHCSIVVIDETGESADMWRVPDNGKWPPVRIGLKGNPVYETHLVSEFFISLDVKPTSALTLCEIRCAPCIFSRCWWCAWRSKAKSSARLAWMPFTARRVYHEDIEACRTLASQIGLAIENATCIARRCREPP